MSDFDKEAEREKLRKRFAEEDEKRESTEQMSELLLQGATMTDTHCDSCGNPLFRYDGQTFCPSCQQSTEGGADDRAATTGAVDDEPAPTNANEGRTAGEQPRAQPSREAGQTPQNTTQQPQGSTPPAQNQQTAAARTDDTTRASRQQPETTTRPAGGASDLGAAEASLSRTLRELTITAEETEDLGRTREHLAAAREAAEALDAVRTARK